jgi:hypothetical protein
LRDAVAGIGEAGGDALGWSDAVGDDDVADVRLGAGADGETDEGFENTGEAGVSDMRRFPRINLSNKIDAGSLSPPIHGVLNKDTRNAAKVAALAKISLVHPKVPSRFCPSF